MKVGLIWITVIYLTWNFDALLELENSDDMEAMDTSQLMSTGMMNTEDKPLHTPVPSGDEVWKISHYCHYQYYVRISSQLQHLPVRPTRISPSSLLGGRGIWTLPWWDGAFEPDVPSLSSVKHVFYWRSFRGEESNFGSEWLRKTIFTS